MVTHRMYAAAGQGFRHWTQATSDDRFFTCLPFYHANIQYYSTMGALASGATLVIVDRFSASRFWGQVREARATVVNFIGMMMPVLAKNDEQPDDADNTVRLFYGSPSFPPEFLEEFQQRFATDIIVGFGMTETCYGTIEGIREERRSGSSGRARQHPDPRFENTIRMPTPRPASTWVPTSSARSPSGTRPSCPATGATMSRTARPCATAGCTPATWAGLTTTAFSTSLTARRTSSAAAARTSPPKKWRTSSRPTPASSTPPWWPCPPSWARDEVKAYVTPREGRHRRPRAGRVLVRRAPGLLQGAPLLGGPRRVAPHAQPPRPQGRAAPGARGPHRRLLRHRGRRHPPALDQLSTQRTRRYSQRTRRNQGRAMVSAPPLRSLR